MSDAAVTALLGSITLPMGIFSGGPGQPWTIGLITAFATSFALFLIVGTPNNAIIYALAIYPDSKKRIIHPLDFVKYGFILWVICMLVLVGLCLVFSHGLVSFPPEITGKARAALEAMKATGPVK
jgi:sodium-dependent dicarboxylate transporter 2/3/5